MRKVLISTGIGTGVGWSTWIGSAREQKEFALFDPKLIAAVERGDDLGTEDDPATPLGDFVRRLKEAFPELVDGPYTRGARSLEVQEVEGPFTVIDYDGAERIVRRDDQEWF
jgi:hypothetical protein